MPLTDYVALVSLTRSVPTEALLRVAAAVQKQLTRDFYPFWGLPATVAAFTDLGSVPSDYHVVAVFGDADDLVDRVEVAIGPELLQQLATEFDRDQLRGIHLNEYTRQPFALVSLSETWSVSVSHEVLEMVTDPFGNRLIAAGMPGEPDRRVNYLVEVCDPCQSAWYPVNGVPVSDFYTPRYFDPVRTDGTRYSFTGELEYPLHILEGGYVSWIDPRNSGLYQLQAGAAEPVLIADISSLASSSAPLRHVVDSDPRTPQLTAQSIRPASSARSAPGAYAAMVAASEGAALRTQEALVSLATGSGQNS